MTSLGRCRREWAAYPRVQAESASGGDVLGAPMHVGSTLLGIAVTNVSGTDTVGWSVAGMAAE